MASERHLRLAAAAARSWSNECLKNVHRTPLWIKTGVIGLQWSTGGYRPLDTPKKQNKSDRSSTLVKIPWRIRLTQSPLGCCIFSQTIIPAGTEALEMCVPSSGERSVLVLFYWWVPGHNGRKVTSPLSWLCSTQGCLEWKQKCMRQPIQAGAYRNDFDFTFLRACLRPSPRTTYW